MSLKDKSLRTDACNQTQNIIFEQLDEVPVARYADAEVFQSIDACASAVIDLGRLHYTHIFAWRV